GWLLLSRAGKELPVTCTEVFVRFRRPPAVYSPTPPPPNYLRFRISPGRADRPGRDGQGSRGGDGGHGGRVAGDPPSRQGGDGRLRAAPRGSHEGGAALPHRLQGLPPPTGTRTEASPCALSSPAAEP